MPIVLLGQVITIVTVIMPFKIVQIGQFDYSAAAFLIPAFYTLTDIISEVFGYQTMRLIMWVLTITTFIFCVLVQIVLWLPPSNFDTYQHLYSHFFATLWKVIGIGVGGWIVGPVVNSIIITKWKILLKGKYFWLRSIGSSISGQIAQVMFCTILAFKDFVSFDIILNMMIFAILYKMTFALIVSFPANMLATFLKSRTGFDVYDRDTKYNPLKLTFH